MEAAKKSAADLQLKYNSLRYVTVSAPSSRRPELTPVLSRRMSAA